MIARIQPKSTRLSKKSS